LAETISQSTSLYCRDNFAQDYGFNINPELTEDQKAELLQLLFDYKSSFARDLSEMKAYPST